jgi:hypothetical protein
LFTSTFFVFVIIIISLFISTLPPLGTRTNIKL